MKKIVGVAICLVLLVTTSALAGGGQEGAAAKPVTIMLRASSKPGLEKIMEDYIAKYPERQVEITRVPIQNYFEQVSVVHASGTASDMWEYWGVETGGYYVDKGFTADITQWGKDHNWDTKFSSASLKQFNRQGVQYGMPLTMHAMFLFYQKPMFQKYGMTVPKTYKELISIVDKFKANGISPFSVGAKDKWHLMRITDSLFEKYCGPKLRDELLVFKTTWIRPEVINIYDELRRWGEQNYFNPGYLGVLQREAKILMYQGKTGMILEGEWWEKNCTDDGQDPSIYDFFIFPTDWPENRTSVFCEGWLFNGKSDNVPAALEFGEFYTSLEEQKKYVMDLAPPSAVLGVSVPAEYKIMNKVIGMFPTLNAFAVTDQGMPPGLWEEYAFVQENILTGNMTSQEGAEYMEEKGKEGMR
ncbi:MAG TPA: extracellular solute-binding protein [archaeon]|nr:extracellular solute-binding protein [archaeon]